MVFCNSVHIPDRNIVVLSNLALNSSSSLAHSMSATSNDVERLLESDINMCCNKKTRFNNTTAPISGIFIKVFISLYLLNMLMDQVDNLDVGRYWSEVLCCTITTLEVKVTDL